MPKVTFSILCYNYGRFLDQAIRSCLEQFSDDLECEVLVINDGSTDNTQEVCSRFAGQIKVVNEGNKGFSSSLTRAIECATGDFVFLLDADDYFLSGKLSAVLPHLLGGSLYVHDRVLPLQPNESIPELTSMNGGSTSTIAVNRKAALDMLPVENELSFHILKQMGHGVIVEKPFTVYRFHSDSMTNRDDAGTQNLYLAGITHRLADRIENILSMEKSPQWFLPERYAKKVAANYRSQAYYNELEAALECGQRMNSFKSCLKMIGYALISNIGLNKLHFKMIIKTLIGKPSFKKQKKLPKYSGLKLVEVGE